MMECKRQGWIVLLMAMLLLTTRSLRADETGVVADPFTIAVAAYRQGDYETACEQWTRALEAGDWAAARSLGTLYRKGLGVPADGPRALAYYQLAVDHGVPNAVLNLAEMYLTGEDVPHDFPKARELLRQAVEDGNPWAARRLQDVTEAELSGEPIVPLPVRPERHDPSALAPSGDNTPLEEEQTDDTDVRNPNAGPSAP